MTLQSSDDFKLLQSESVKTLCSWQLLGPSDVKNIIMGMSTKSCSLDVFPTFFLKQVIVLLLPILQHIINESLRMSYVPPALKRAVVIPTIKKRHLDPDVFSNYRPINNILISKVIEKCVLPTSATFN